MKKFLATSLVLVLLVASFGCSKSDPTPTKGPDATPTTEAVATATTAPADAGFELALVTDLGTIDDKSFNQGSWEGLKQYADEKSITYKYYQPTEQSDDAYLSTIELAVKGGAKVIVTPGFLFQVPIYIAQDRYPNVNFILVDSSPASADGETKVGTNTVGITYAEEQAGYLAGYAAVKDGLTKLGYMGGMALPPVVRYGYGFVQGAEAAGVELGLAAGTIQINYYYTGGFAATPEAQAMAASWYNDGIEVIFAAGGAVGNSVMTAAAAASPVGKVIGVDVDQSGESPTVITSALKGVRASVYSCVSDYYAGKFPGGKELVFAAENDGVGLVMDTAKFDTFSQADFEAVFAKLKANSIAIKKDSDVGSASELPLTISKVTEF
jgi:basic membrane protein A